MENFAKTVLTKKRDWIFAILLIALGAALRLVSLGSLPDGLNQDEASSGYEAWSLLNYGIDRHGYNLPVLFKSWGSGQNVLYSYLSIPFIAFFGLSPFSIRLLSAVAGIATLPVFWLLARETRGRAFALTALLMLAVNPWHIMISRWALESNLLPFFLTLGIYLLALSLRRPLALIPAALSFSLSLYAYGTAFLFLCFYLILGFLWLIRYNAVRAKSFIPALVVFALIALPVTICQINNIVGNADISLWGLAMPRLTESRQAATTIFGGGAFSAVENYKGFLSLVLTQSDGLPFNSLPFYGIFYFFGLPFAIAGIISAIANFRDRRGETLIIAALAVSVMCAFFIDPNINRMNMAWIPLIYFQAAGVHMLMRKMKKFFVIPIFFLLTFTALFSVSYVNALSTSPYYFSGLRQAVEYVEKQTPESVHITNYVNQPYIFILLYNKVSPYDFISTVNYVNPGAAFEHVSGFGKYSFGNASAANAEYIILHNSESGGLDIEKVFGQYSVCAGQK